MFVKCTWKKDDGETCLLYLARATYSFISRRYYQGETPKKAGEDSTEE